MKVTPRLLLGLGLAAGIALALIYREHLDAAALLARQGFARAQVVRGGMTAWRELGWPMADVAASLGSACHG